MFGLIFPTGSQPQRGVNKNDLRYTETPDDGSRANITRRLPQIPSYDSALRRQAHFVESGNYYTRLLYSKHCCIQIGSLT